MTAQIASLSLADVAGLTGAELRGDPAVRVDHVQTLDRAGPGALSFLANPRYRPLLADTRAAAVILGADDADDCPVACLVSDNPYLAHSRVLMALYPAARPVPGVHASAVVAPDAQIDGTAEVGPNCYVGSAARIGPNVVIGPNCVLLDDVQIDRDSRLVASVTLGPGTRLGERCLIHPGAVIGGDGFGLANDDGAWVKVPQIGRAVLGDDVEVGSCSSVDRGAIGDTEIGDGVKLDSQVHVAHNVKVGRHTAMAGCAAVAGSSQIGAYCTVAGAAGITGHVALADHVHISGATSVTRSIDRPGLYTGTVPAMEHAAWLKNFARLRHLDDMVRRVRKLEKEVAALRQQDDAAD
jgi:UDP-3-O-[3-hydroxymyristoyl] glucosamine N-acyltransferase